MIGGIYSTITGKAFIVRRNEEKYTEESLPVYYKLSGILRILIGAAIVMCSLGNTSMFSILICWAFASILWLAIAANITVYMVALVRK